MQQKNQRRIKKWGSGEGRERREQKEGKGENERRKGRMKEQNQEASNKVFYLFNL